MTAATRNRFPSSQYPSGTWERVPPEGPLPGANDDLDSQPCEGAIQLGNPGLPENDITAQPDRARLVARLNDDGLRRGVLGYLGARHGLPWDAADDVTNEAWIDAWKAKSWPENETRPLYPWLCGYAKISKRRHVKSMTRRARVEATEDMGVFPSPDNTRSDEYRDAARAMKLVTEQGGASDADAAEMLRAKLEDGKTFKESAEERGIAEDTVDKRVRRLLLKVRKHLLESGSATAVVLAFLFLFIQVRTEKPRVADRLPLIPAQLAPLPRLPTAAELRLRGLAQCDQGHFVPCLRLLDRAKKLDPAGETAPAIVGARDHAAKGMAPDGGTTGGGADVPVAEKPAPTKSGGQRTPQGVTPPHPKFNAGW
jgi:DNA-directed RNA polymerase specialized sigma24 family protein